ncbi:MAG: Smr/MutS family protein [Acidobacteriota bacterium]|nr:Smr/MutS family protein [Acidobacteriota bacterium]
MKHDSILFHKYHPPSLECDEDLDDQELFKKAMAEVKPLGGKARPVLGKKSPGTEKEDEEIVGPWDLMETYLKEQERTGWESMDPIQGGPEEWNELLLKKLRQGAFSVQAELDLHGLSKQEARLELEDFIAKCRRQNRTCVRIVHGKGTHSKDGIPVLKGLVQRWLSQRRLSKQLVAYASARPVDGGAGAIYLLLPT